MHLLLFLAEIFLRIQDFALCSRHKFMVRWNYKYYKEWKNENGHFQAAISLKQATQEIEKQMEQLEDNRN